MDIQELVQGLREDRTSTPEDTLDAFYKEYLYYKQLAQVADNSGDADLIAKFSRILNDKYQLITDFAMRKGLDNPLDKPELDEEGGSVTGGGSSTGATFTSGEGMQYAAKGKRELNNEEKDREPKLAAGKRKKIYAVTHFGFTPAPSIPNRKSTGGFEYKSLWEGVLAENYNSFRKSTSTRTKAEQYHQGVKMVRKELSRVNTLMEYLNKLKSSLNEEGGLKEMVYTRKSVDQIMERIISIYKKAKTL